MLEKIWEWYGATAYTRLAPGGGVLLIQTCWSDLDLAGRIQQAMKDDPEFAKNPGTRLDFFYRRHPAWDAGYDHYPVLRTDTPLE